MNMSSISIVDNGNEAVVYLNRDLLGSEFVDGILAQLNRYSFDDSHIPCVDEDEQSEIEQILNSLNEDDKAIEETRNYRIQGIKYERID